MPNLHFAGQRQPRQDQGQDHRKGLRSDNDAVAVGAVCHRAAEWGEKKNRNLTGETYGTQQQRGPGQAVHQPGLGNALHPRPDQ